MSKGYVSNWKKCEEPLLRHITDYFFDSRPEKAAIWDTLEDAHNDCIFFENIGITIQTSNGEQHKCHSFQSEQREDGKYVIYCEAPFTMRVESRVK